MIKDYDGFFSFADLTGQRVEEIARIAERHNVTINIDAKGLDFTFVGRDADDRVLRFLYEIASIVVDAGGEVQLRCDPDDGEFYFCFYEIADGKLSEQRATVHRHAPEVVSSDRFFR